MSFVLSDKKLRHIENHIQKNYINSGKYPGVLIGFYNKGDVTLLDPLGMLDVERSSPMGKDSIFRIYSMSKPITSKPDFAKFSPQSPNSNFAFSM